MARRGSGERRSVPPSPRLPPSLGATADRSARQGGVGAERAGECVRLASKDIGGERRFAATRGGFGVCRRTITREFSHKVGGTPNTPLATLAVLYYFCSKRRFCGSGGSCCGEVNKSGT